MRFNKICNDGKKFISSSLPSSPFHCFLPSLCYQLSLHRPERTLLWDPKPAVTTNALQEFFPWHWNLSAEMQSSVSTWHIMGPLEIKLNRKLTYQFIYLFLVSLRPRKRNIINIDYINIDYVLQSFKLVEEQKRIAVWILSELQWNEKQGNQG